MVRSTKSKEKKRTGKSTGNVSTCSRRLPMPITPTVSPVSTAGSSVSPNTEPEGTSVSPLPLAVITEAPNLARTSMEETREKDNLESFIAEQREFNQRVLQLINQGNCEANGQLAGKAKNDRLPLKLTESVRAVYKEMEAASEKDEVKLWDFTKGFAAQENSAVNHAIGSGVRSTENEFSSAQIRAAIRTHFKTRKRRWSMEKKKTSGQYLKSQRSRSRLNTKRLQRQKALRDSTSTKEEEKVRIRAVLTNDYMSSDESISDSSDKDDNSDSDSLSDSDSGVTKRKILVVKSLPWRSQELKIIFDKLDKRISRKRSPKGQSMVMQRRKGEPSSRRAPDDAPSWALAQ